jgi:hypothetical protein
MRAFGSNMITLEDCVGLCRLTEEEVLALAEHEHLPEIRRIPRLDPLSIRGASGFY